MSAWDAVRALVLGDRLDELNHFRKADMDSNITTPEQVEGLAPGQWVFAADGHAYCLVDTNIGWPQRMWMTHDGMSHIAVEGIAYPLTLTEVAEDCDHIGGCNECGHCRRCGALVGEPRQMVFTPLLEVQLSVDYSDDATARRFEAIDVRDSDHDTERGQ